MKRIAVKYFISEFFLLFVKEISSNLHFYIFLTRVYLYIYIKREIEIGKCKYIYFHTEF